MTSIPGGGGPGDRRVEITPQSALGASGGFFQGGNRVVLNPCAPNQRIATVRALGSLIFTSPLGGNHLSGEMVASLGPDNTDRDFHTLTGLEEIAFGTDSTGRLARNRRQGARHLFPACEKPIQ